MSVRGKVCASGDCVAVCDVVAVINVAVVCAYPVEAVDKLGNVLVRVGKHDWGHASTTCLQPLDIARLFGCVKGKAKTNSQRWCTVRYERS